MTCTAEWIKCENAFCKPQPSVKIIYWRSKIILPQEYDCISSSQTADELSNSLSEQLLFVFCFTHYYRNISTNQQYTRESSTKDRWGEKLLGLTLMKTMGTLNLRQSVQCNIFLTELHLGVSRLRYWMDMITVFPLICKNVLVTLKLCHTCFNV